MKMNEKVSKNGFMALFVQVILYSLIKYIISVNSANFDKSWFM